MNRRDVVFQDRVVTVRPPTFGDIVFSHDTNPMMRSAKLLARCSGVSLPEILDAEPEDIEFLCNAFKELTQDTVTPQY